MNPAGSLYGRLLAWLTLPLLTLGALLLLQAWLEARATADRAYDRLLDAATLAIAEQVQWQDERLWLDLPPAALEMLAGDAQERVFYSLVDQQGRHITGNARLPEHSGASAASGDTLLYRDIERHGMALRQGIRRTRLEDWRSGEPFEVRVAHTREGRDALRLELLRSNLAGILAMGALAVATLLLAVRAALKPLTRLRHAIRARDPRTLKSLDLELPRELAELREALNELLARMRRVRANQERFIGDASHQLRTPLAGITARAELALRRQEPEEWRTALETVHSTSERTARLAMQLLSLTRLDNPEYRPELHPVDLNDCVRQAVRDHWVACHQAGIDLGADCLPSPLPVAASEWQLQEALANLIDNSRRYGAHRITLGVLSDPPRLFVEDDGPGIPAERRLLVLRPFHRGRDDGEGSGLGLAIVDGIARNHGARLDLAESDSGRGLRVEMRFPEAPT
ncbi:sensor histidine kinase [Halomonas alimentaria]|uniref:sensor histidine kinase n=1 Tax=Halomonas alimentaria TaxID=147248 RepID=UPI0024939701|nr:sensor histidine kinase [Halomonas alimentaria]